MKEPPSSVKTAASELAHACYGRLIAMLASPNSDLADAEDAVAEAFLAALTHWPASGVPRNPEAWLYKVARNRQLNRLQSAARRTSALIDRFAAILATEEALDFETIPDRRLALMFLCAHPAINATIRTPLMLQTVLGCEAGQIAKAFAIPKMTMSQRLVRAKRRIKAARIPFVIPERTVMAERLPFVLEAIYGAYAIDWDGISGPSIRESLAAEALHLACMLASLLPREPEVLGLAALICLSLARAGSRTGSEGGFVPLDRQDVSSWDRVLIQQGEAYLHRAFDAGRPGRFQIEAAIQSNHCARIHSAETDWSALEKLQTELVRIAPTLGARVALASIVAESKGLETGLQVLDAIEDWSIERFQPAWATRAHLLDSLRRTAQAERAYEKAISLTTDLATRSYLTDRLQRLKR
jgi:RNA polymerase sigma-70 factor (ECF subfamily)